MPKQIQINDSVKQMKLNAENRQKFTNVILRDALGARSDAIRKEMAELREKFYELSWGKTPQARAAVKKRITRLEGEAQELERKGFPNVIFTIGRNRDHIDLNLGGAAIRLYFLKKPRTAPIINLNDEFCSKYGSREYERRLFLNGEVTLPADHKLAKKYFQLEQEAKAIQDAGEELESILGTILGKARTLGAALDKWPELSQYVPAILSASREIMVRPEVLNARLDALKSGKLSAKDAMAVGRD